MDEHDFWGAQEVSACGLFFAVCSYNKKLKSNIVIGP